MSLEKRTEGARKFFASRGCIMTGEYVNERESVEYTCRCGKEGCVVKLRVAKGTKGGENWSGCKECAIKKRVERAVETKKLRRTPDKTLARRTEEAAKFFISKGCTMTGEYINSLTKVEYTCSCGKEGCYVKLRHAKQKGWAGCKNCALEKTRKTNLERWGFECALKAPSVIEKTKKTMKEKYGTKTPLLCPEVLEKKKKTMVERYGVEHSLQDEGAKLKCRKTSLKNNGVECCLALPENRKRNKGALCEKYGEKGPLGNKKVREKRDTMMVKKYGTKHALQREEFREKATETWKQKYGVEHPSQHPDIRAKTISSSFNFKNYEFPSGRRIRVQGYEHLAADIMLREGIPEDDIVSCQDKILSFRYEYQRKKKIYFPDFFIPSQNLIVEVKSNWTFRKTKDEEQKTLTKLAACRDAGYKTRLLVLGAKGEILDDIRE